jgi:hypothetical protein
MQIPAGRYLCVRKAVPQSVKSDPRQWVDGSDPTYSERLSWVFLESHQRELVDGFRSNLLVESA